MKLLVDKIINSEFAILLRNSLHYKPVYLKTFKKKYPCTVSDAFLWRTDNDFKTKFKYTDILNLFYKIENSWVELHFYSKDNKLLKIKKINNLNLSNDIEIDSKFLNNLNDYGVFFIYHFTNSDTKIDSENIISNRCYLGYSNMNNLYSFVHGNTLAKFASINSKEKILTDLVKTSFFKNHSYTIQKYFKEFDKNELIFTNPTSKLINFTLDNKNYILKPNNTLLLESKSPIISIRSNCLFLRPTVFSYKGKYFDVHHS